MAKQLVAQVKFQVPGGQATPAPPVGTSLGRFGINLGQFVMQFNERTREAGGMPIPVVVNVYNDRSFEFVTKSPPAAALLKQAAGIAKGSGVPNKEKVGKVTQAQIENIVKLKMADLNARDVEHAKRMVEGTARSMGLITSKSPHGRTAAGTTDRRRPTNTISIKNLRQHPASNDPHADSSLRLPRNEPRTWSKSSSACGASTEKLPGDTPVPVEQAVTLLKQFNNTKFDQSVDIAMRLGIDPKQADQLVRGSIVLPHGIGKTLRVIVFAKGDLAEQAKAAGADEVGAEELAKKIKDGWTDFDACIAAPDMMGLVGPLGRVLGPRGLMPSPRAGTVTPEVGQDGARNTRPARSSSATTPAATCTRWSAS